jgi:hypothetical protein
MVFEGTEVSVVVKRFFEQIYSGSQISRNTNAEI